MNIQCGELTALYHVTVTGLVVVRAGYHWDCALRMKS